MLIGELGRSDVCVIKKNKKATLRCSRMGEQALIAADKRLAAVATAGGRSISSPGYGGE
jgi:hypothetical protein